MVYRLQLVAVIQLAEKKADLERQLDSKLQGLRDSHEQELQRLTSEFDVKKQKLRDSYQQHVSAKFVCILLLVLCFHIMLLEILAVFP